MEANRLMIGDWVRRCWTCEDTGREVVRDFQITEIRKNGETLYAWGKSGNMGRVDELEPIPITAEILEKNGFVKSGNYEVWRIICNDYEMRVTPWRFAVIFLENGADKEEYSAPRPSFVHELQQALRLCGIKKEIEL